MFQPLIIPGAYEHDLEQDEALHILTFHHVYVGSCQCGNWSSTGLQGHRRSEILSWFRRGSILP